MIRLCVAMLLALGSVPLPAEAVEQFTVAPGGELEIDLETGGSIEIAGWDEDRVTVEASFGRNDPSRVELETRYEAGKVIVRSRFKTDDHKGQYGGRVTIRCPRRFDVEISTRGGGIKVENLIGTIRGTTMGGAIELSRLEGVLDLETMGGEVGLRESKVEGTVLTYGGNVHFEDVEGTVEARTFGGNVVYDNVRPAGSGEVDGEVKVSTHGGNIEVPFAPTGANLQTMGGNIVVERAAEYVKAKTMGGNITIRSVDGWVRASTFGGNIEVTMVGDPGAKKRDVRLESKSGEIRLTLPRGISAEIDLTLAYTKQSKRNYEIHSDFPLELREAQGWDYSSGSPRKYVYATATIGDGRNRIKIETTNGDLRLIEGN